MEPKLRCLSLKTQCCVFLRDLIRHNQRLRAQALDEIAEEIAKKRWRRVAEGLHAEQEDDDDYGEDDDNEEELDESEDEE